MAKLKTAYGKKKDIERQISNGVIPPGTLILTEDSNEMYFYNLDCGLCAYQEKYKFSSKQEAEYWISQYGCKGEIISVHEDNTCNAYLVGYDGSLVKLSKEAQEEQQVQADWNTTDPNDPSYIKNKPSIVSDKSYIHDQMSASKVWEIVHNLDKFPSVSVVDSAGSVVVGEVNYIDNNKLTITFNSTFSGKVYLN